MTPPLEIKVPINNNSIQFNQFNIENTTPTVVARFQPLSTTQGSTDIHYQVMMTQSVKVDIDGVAKDIESEIDSKVGPAYLGCKVKITVEQYGAGSANSNTLTDSWDVWAEVNVKVEIDYDRVITVSEDLAGPVYPTENTLLVDDDLFESIHVAINFSHNKGQGKYFVNSAVALGPDDLDDNWSTSAPLGTSGHGYLGGGSGVIISSGKPTLAADATQYTNLKNQAGTADIGKIAYGKGVINFSPTVEPQ